MGPDADAKSSGQFEKQSDVFFVFRTLHRMVCFEMVKMAYGGCTEVQNSSTEGADLSDIFLSHKQDWVLSLLQQCAADLVYLILLRGCGSVCPGK